MKLAPTTGNEGTPTVQIMLRTSLWTLIPDTDTYVTILEQGPETLDLATRRKRAGQLLAEHRLRAGLTQARLADELCRDKPTITRHDICRWERGVRIPGQHWMSQLTRRLGLSENVLVAIAAARGRSELQLKPRVAIRSGHERTASHVVTIPFGAWTPLPECSWRARPRSMTWAFLASSKEPDHQARP